MGYAPQGPGHRPKKNKYLSTILHVLGVGIASISFKLMYDEEHITFISFSIFVVAIILISLGIKYHK